MFSLHLMCFFFFLSFFAFATKKVWYFPALLRRMLSDRTIRYQVAAEATHLLARMTEDSQ